VQWHVWNVVDLYGSVTPGPPYTSYFWHTLGL